MKCTDCQFHLLCHAGRLDSWSKDHQSIVMLCPRCNRLCVGHHETLHIFECEQRKLSEATFAAVQKAIESNAFTMSSTVLVEDTGPGLIGKLTWAFCPDCMDALPPQMRNITIKYLDENREEPVAAKMTQQRAAAISADEEE